MVKKPLSDKKTVNIGNECKLVKHRNLVVNDNEYKVPISVTSNNQQGVNTNKWFSKNRFAPLNDISPRSRFDDHKVLPFKQTDNNDKGSTNKGHKVGVARGERLNVIQSIQAHHK